MEKKELKKTICGGHSEEGPIDPEMQALAVSMKAEIEAKVGKSFTVFAPVSYTSQVVAGMNYRVRISVDEGKTIIATIYKPLPCYHQPNKVTSASWI